MHALFPRLNLPALACGLYALLIHLPCAAENPPGKPAETDRHLFILSGQSNMTGALEGGFREVMRRELGEGRAVIVRQSKSGRGIRFWVDDNDLPDDHPLHGEIKSGNGEEFPKLLAAAQSAGDAKAFATVTFIWMQGESDANRNLADTYAKSFTTLRNRLKAGLGIERMHFVIGRISDYGLHGEQAAGWEAVRKAQMDIANTDPLGAWIDTDDLNGGDEQHPQGELHYPAGQYPALGARLAAAALVQLRDAKLQLGTPFADNAVFQQGIPLPIWGTARPGATIEAAFAGQIKSTTANPDGTWRITLDPLKGTRLTSVHDQPEGHTLILTSTLEGGKAVRELRNIAIGDVWLCAGQSNMAGSIRTAVNPKNHPPDTVATANHPGLRFLNVEKQSWEPCTPETVLGCSRVAFFFARRVQRDALVPIGLIVRAVGGSNIESWLNHPPEPVGDNYARLMTPVVGYGLRGAIWYQGESNEKDGLAYRPKLASLITGWRKAWGQGDFPFHFVQLPGINESPIDNPAMGDGRAAIRQAFFETLALPNTGMAVAIDVGTKGEHPPNKFDTAERLARSVLQKVYGLDNITSCPLYKSHQVEGNTIRVSFTDDAKHGLMIAKKATTLPEAFAPPVPTPDAKLQWLSIQDEDGQWHWADAKIDGAELIVSAEGVAKPIAVRYAYTTQPLGHLLYNQDGLPVGPFSTCGHGETADTKPQAPKP